MASIAFDGPSFDGPSFDSPGANPASKQPISAHPAFAVIVALWFAALLGLGSLVLPAVLLDRLVVGTGIASLVPAASPPLGMTAHAAIAAAAAVAGAFMGLAIARRVARAQEREAAPRFSGIKHGPISVHEELGGEGLLNGCGAPITRRRAMAIAEDDTLELRDAAPDEPTELAEPPFEDREMTGRQEFQPIPPREADDEPKFEAADEIADEEQPSEAPAPDPLAFAAPSLARQLDHPIEPPSWGAPVGPDEPAAEPVAERADWITAEPEQLGLVQLVQRLGSSIERRRAWIAERGGAPATALHSVPVEFEAAPPEEAAQAMANYFGRPDTAPNPLVPDARSAPEIAPAARPHPLRSPLVVDADEEQPLGPDEDEPDDDSEAGYSSLLELNNPFAARESEFVRIDEPEDDPDLAMATVVFPVQQASFAPSFAAAPAQAAELPAAAQQQFDAPGQGPAPAKPSADTDAALRAALATLQRMSGAA